MGAIFDVESQSWFIQFLLGTKFVGTNKKHWEVNCRPSWIINGTAENVPLDTRPGVMIVIIITINHIISDVEGWFWAQKNNFPRKIECTIMDSGTYSKVLDRCWAWRAQRSSVLPPWLLYCQRFFHFFIGSGRIIGTVLNLTSSKNFCSAITLNSDAFTIAMKCMEWKMWDLKIVCLLDITPDPLWKLYI